jgi:hypothetical protein
MHVEVRLRVDRYHVRHCEYASNLITLIWTPFSTPPSSLFNKLIAFPALYPYLLDADSFVEHLNLTSNQQVKIGQQTNAKTVWRIMGILTPRF